MKKVIGVCTSLTNAEITREALSSLHRAAKEAGISLVVFNSVIDFKYRKSKGAEEIYHIIPYGMLDSLVMLYDSIHDDEIVSSIIYEAKNAGVPVIASRRQVDGVFSVVGKYEDAFEKMIRNLVEVHNTKDIVYISGRRDIETNPNSDSAKRYVILKDILEEYGISFGMNNVRCGEYWEAPTRNLIDKYIRENDALPDAFVCANDIMALAASNRLKEHGYTVPNDVIVTGFDGLECSRYSVPRIMTCKENLDEMARLVIEMTEDICLNNRSPYTSFYQYEFLSGGFENNDERLIEERNDASLIYQSLRASLGDEEFSNRWLEGVLDSESFDDIKVLISEYVFGNRLLLLRGDDSYLRGEELGNETMPLFAEKLFPYRSNSVEGAYYSNIDKEYSLDKVFKNLGKHLSPEWVMVISTVFVNNLTLGIYFEKLKDFYDGGYLYHRHVQTLNMGIESALIKERQNQYKSRLERSKYMDTITNFSNMHGVHRWFDHFSSLDENHEKYIEACIFAFINRDEITDEFGIETCETCIRFIGENLKNTHPDNTMISRISENRFLVFMFFDNDIERRDTIFESVDKFYEGIQHYNEEHAGREQIEVSSGSVDMNPGWNGSLNTYINSADNEMYKNRMAYYSSARDNEVIDTGTERAALNGFNLIMKENRLTYFYQPIVDVYTGDIVAYEALMRTTGDISYSPLELLSIAKRHRALYSIERATMFNVFADYASKKDEFKDRLIFINTIPGEFLYEEDVDEIRKSYGNYLKNAVIEITEDESISSDELEKIRKFGSDRYEVNIAIDDYGTGHSNMVNLINYKPQVVKIDRFLITDIHKDKNKQMFVNSIISFSRDNDIRVLAEGVETSEELEMVIKLGVDLIQGYYTAKPAPEILQELPETLREEIRRYVSLR